MAKMNIPPLDLVKIVWRDASVRSGWHDWNDPDGRLDPVEVHTVGWIVKKNKNFITITQTICELAAGNLTTIPRSWVKKITRLK